MIASLVAWLIVAGLGALWVAAVAGGFLLLAMGRLTLDLGWGRSIHELGPIVVRIAAPRELVFEMIRAPYSSRPPGGSGVEQVARGDGLTVAAHHSRVHFYTARTVEAVELESPSRVRFTHIAGPVPHAVEEFALADADDGTELRYSGEIGIDFWILGRIAARRWVRPQWERVVREHLDDLQARAEDRAARGAR